MDFRASVARKRSKARISVQYCTLVNRDGLRGSQWQLKKDLNSPFGHEKKNKAII